MNKDKKREMQKERFLQKQIKRRKNIEVINKQKLAINLRAFVDKYAII